MLSSLLSSGCEVKLHLLQSAIYLTPPQLPPGSRPPSPGSRSRSLSTPPATNDVLIRGLIELYVPSDRRITAIKLKLRAVQTVAVLDPVTGTQPVNWEETVLLEKRLVIPDNTLLPPSRPSSPSRQHQHQHQHQQEHASSAASTSLTLLGSLRNRSLSRNPARTTSRPRLLPETTTTQPEPRGRQATRTSDLLASSTPSAADNTESNPASAASSRTVSPHPQPQSQSQDHPISPPPPSTSSSTNNSHPHHPERPDFGIPPSPSHSHSRPPHPPSSAPNGNANANANGTGSKRSASVGFFGNLRQVSRSRSRAPPPSSRRSTSGLFSSDSQDHSGGGAPATAGGGDELDEVEDVPDEEEERGQAGHQPDYREGRSRQARGGARALPSSSSSSSSRSRLSAASAGQALVAAPSARGGGRGVRTSVSASSHRASSLGPTPPSSAGSNEGLELIRGVHGFEFAFILPSDSPPYERSPYGRVRYIIKATAVGAGRARSDVSAWRDVFPVVNPSVDGGPTALQVLYNDLHPTVGLLSISCTSNSISVGGIFNVDIASPLPPPDLTVYLVRISLETHIELYLHSKSTSTSSTSKRERQIVPPQRRKLFERGYVPPRTGDPHGSLGDGSKTEGVIRSPGDGERWEINAVARMPDDNAIRPSTVAGTRADVRFRHLLIVEIVHSRAPEEEQGEAAGEAGAGFVVVEGGPSHANGNGTGAGRSSSKTNQKGKSKEREKAAAEAAAAAKKKPAPPERKIKVFTLRQPITLPSCCVAFDSVQLPAYTSRTNGGGAGEEESARARPVDLPLDYGSSHLGEPGAPPRPTSSTTSWEDISASHRRAQFGPTHEHCVCGQSLEDLREAERALEEVWSVERRGVVRAGWGGEGEGVRGHGKIGEWRAVLPEGEGAVGEGQGQGRRGSLGRSVMMGTGVTGAPRSGSTPRSRSGSQQGQGQGQGPVELGHPTNGSGTGTGRPLRRLSASSTSTSTTSSSSASVLGQSVRSGLRGRGFSVGTGRSGSRSRSVVRSGSVVRGAVGVGVGVGEGGGAGGDAPPAYEEREGGGV
ncbi:hypothetical protein CF336_g4731 [Tilletia laevis]|nr:hypothetical protein CF336_g4731 [Tilletia laevis]KAE8207590.1 hypothetical protein CF335_g1037 [Tilletia laevis]